jgi:hypothetical protein
MVYFYKVCIPCFEHSKTTKFSFNAINVDMIVGVMRKSVLEWRICITILESSTVNASQGYNDLLVSLNSWNASALALFFSQQSVLLDTVECCHSFDAVLHSWEHAVDRKVLIWMIKLRSFTCEYLERGAYCGAVVGNGRKIMSINLATGPDRWSDHRGLTHSTDTIDERPSLKAVKLDEMLKKRLYRSKNGQPQKCVLNGNI